MRPPASNNQFEHSTCGLWRTGVRISKLARFKCVLNLCRKLLARYGWLGWVGGKHKPLSSKKNARETLPGHVDPPDKRHSFGAYCLYRVPREKRKKFEPPSRMGIWIDMSKRTTGGHLIMPTYTVVCT